MPPKVLILRAPGTNCDLETAYAFERAGATTERLHINRLLENPRQFADFQILCLPGGFSYGDDIAAGRILGSQIQSHLGDQLQEFKAAGKLILGICNGFQILARTGNVLIDIDPKTGPEATLTLNRSGKFEDRWVQLKVGATKCVFLQGIQEMYLPVAHAEGNFVCRDEATLARLSEHGQVALRYAHLHAPVGAGATSKSSSEASATAEVPYPQNPNGSRGAVAGFCDSTGRVLGLMPHPERHIDPTHHPRWTRGEAKPVGDGLKLFENAVAYFS